MRSIPDRVATKDSCSVCSGLSSSRQHPSWLWLARLARLLLAGLAGKGPCSGGRDEEDSNGGSASGSWGSSNRCFRGGRSSDCRFLATAHLAHH